jgi:type IV secretory pathway VirB6-like protein
MAVWILFFAANTFLPFGPEGGVGSLWNKGAKKIFRFAVVLALLQSSQSFWDYIFIPVMSAGMAFSNTIVNLSDPYEAANGISETGPSPSAGTGASPYCQTSTGSEGVAGAVAIMTQMNCPLATVQSQFAKGMLVGIAQIWGSVTHAFLARTICSIVGGLFLIGIHFFAMILYPIFLIDVVMRVTIVTILAPIALAASMFEPTRRIAHKAAWQLVQAALTLVFVSIVAGIGKATVAYVFSTLMVNGSVAGATDWASLIQLLEDQKTASGQDFYIDLTTMAFYELLGVGVILLFMLRQAGRMAAEFTGSPGGDFSGALAGTAALAGAALYAGGVAAQRLVTGAGMVGGGRGASALAARVTASGVGDADPAAEET